MILRNCPRCGLRLFALLGSKKIVCAGERCDYTEPLPPDLQMRGLGERVAPTLPGFGEGGRGG